ncbi:MAG: hypothetical protein V3V22_04480 [Methylococcales bacterium]
MTTVISDNYFPWEGAFVLDAFRNLRLPTGVNAITRYIFLSRQVQRWPKGLAFRVCRINCAIRMQDQEAVYAAVLDLFYILEDKGQAYRQRILNKVSDHVADEMKSVLEQAISGEISSDNLPYSPRSVLHDGMRSEDKEFEVVTSTSTLSMMSPDLDPVNTARMCLESGQIEQAQDLLEIQLEIEPEREDLRRDLLEIYCATKNATAFHSSYQLLQIRGCLDKSWNEAVSLFAMSN